MYNVIITPLTSIPTSIKSIKNPSFRACTLPESTSFQNFSAMLSALQFRQTPNVKFFIWFLVFLVSFHLLQSMLQSQVLHTIHNYYNDVNIITVLASSWILVLVLINSCNVSSVVDTFDALASRFDFMKDQSDAEVYLEQLCQTIWLLLNLVLMVHHQLDQLYEPVQSGSLSGPSQRVQFYCPWKRIHWFQSSESYSSQEMLSVCICLLGQTWHALVVIWYVLAICSHSHWKLPIQCLLHESPLPSLQTVL